MRRILFNIVVLIGTAVFLVSLFENNVSAQTQFELTRKFSKEFASADAELTKVYGKIMKIYGDDKEFIEKMKTAQRAWIKFRDAHIDSLFPAKDKQLEYGSSFQMCYSSWMTRLTRERIEQLNVWVKGVEEGEVCSGSIRTKDALQNKR